MSKFISKLLVAVAGFFLAASAIATESTHHRASTSQSANADATTTTTIVSVAASNKDFSTLVKALKAAQLDKALAGKGPFTVFAPDDAAFNALPAGALDKLMDNKKELAKVLKFHVVKGDITSDKIKEGTTTVKTLEGKTIQITKNADGVMVNGAKVTQADIKAGNGVIHVIDAVLIPKAKEAKAGSEKGMMQEQAPQGQDAE